MNSYALIAATDPVGFAIGAWLHAKEHRSHSARTRALYATLIADYRATVRAALASAESDLLSPSCTTELATIAQAWAVRPRQRDGAPVAPATAHLRLAAVSSFYTYARKMGYTTAENPIERVERGPVATYAAAAPLLFADVAARMAAIPTTTATGRRDKAILAMALATGRRLSEIAGLVLGDLAITTPRAMTVTFRRTKGGKPLRDTLPPEVASIVWHHLVSDRAHTTPADPLWVSYAGPSTTRGGALGTRSLHHLLKRHLGTTKFHALRHTYAHAMEAAGAPVSVVQARLGHTSLAVTGRYLAALRSAENPYGAAVANLLGLDRITPRPRSPQKNTIPLAPDARRQRDSAV
jgi:integrase